MLEHSVPFCSAYLHKPLSKLCFEQINDDDDDDDEILHRKIINFSTSPVKCNCRTLRSAIHISTTMLKSDFCTSRRCYFSK